MYLQTITYTQFVHQEKYIMVSALYDEEDPSLSILSDSTLVERRRSKLSKIVSETFKTSALDEGTLTDGINFEMVDEDKLLPIVENIKKRYDEDQNGELDEGEVNKMLIDALKMGANEKHLVSENDDLNQKVRHYDLCAS